MVKNVMKVLFFLQLVAAILTVVPSKAYSGEMVVKPAKFDHFEISLPEEIVAGRDIRIQLQAVDAFNNPVSDFGDTTREFQVSVSDSAVASPTAFKAYSSEKGKPSLVKGAVTLTLHDKVAETINLAVRESGSPIPLFTKNLTVMPAKIDSFLLKVPHMVQAGEKFDIKIVAKDSFGNTVSDPVLGKNLSLIFKGDVDQRTDTLTIPDFKNGTSVVSLMLQKAGTVVMEARDLMSGITGSSGKIQIINGPANSFRIFTPKEALAGEPFEVSVVALDSFDNIVTDYAKRGSGIQIASSGKAKLHPATIPASEFLKGQARFDLKYDAAPADINITVTANKKKQKGVSDSVSIIAPVVERYEIVTPASAVAGQKFKIKITAYNQHGLVFKNYHAVGPTVDLATTGSGNIVPASVPSSEFVAGTAVVEVQYNKADSFTIIATPGKAGVVAKRSSKTPGKGHSRSGAASTKSSGSAKSEKEATREHGPFDITDISIVEPKKNATIAINIPKMDRGVKYSVNTQMIDGKKWIVVTVKPVVNKIEKVLKLDSPLFGRVVLEDDKNEKSATVIKIEQIKPSRFHVTKGKDALLVTLLN